MEKSVSGYCRVQDGARIVLVELEQGSLEADCEYEGCAYRAECPIGRQITAMGNGEDA